MSQRMDAYVLTDAKYARIAEAEGIVRSGVLPGFFLKPEWLWQDPLPKVAGVFKELGITS